MADVKNGTHRAETRREATWHKTVAAVTFHAANAPKQQSTATRPAQTQLVESDVGILGARKPEGPRTVGDLAQKRLEP